MTKRKTYLKIARALTAPLINAYTAMLRVTNAAQAEAHLENDHSLQRHIIPTTGLHTTLRETMEATHIQEHPSNVLSLLLNLDSIHTVTPYTLSDAAFSIEGADEPP